MIKQLTDTQTICTFVHTPKLHYLPEVHRDLVNCKYITSTMYYKLLTAIYARYSYHPTAEEERRRYVRLAGFLNRMETEKRRTHLEQVQLNNLWKAVEEDVKQLNDVRTRCPLELYFLAGVYDEYLDVDT